MKFTPSAKALSVYVARSSTTTSEGGSLVRSFILCLKLALSRDRARAGLGTAKLRPIANGYFVEDTGQKTSVRRPYFVSANSSPIVMPR